MSSMLAYNFRKLGFPTSSSHGGPHGQKAQGMVPGSKPRLSRIAH